jgi:hypothetical protein
MMRKAFREAHKKDPSREAVGRWLTVYRAKRKRRGKPVSRREPSELL